MSDNVVPFPCHSRNPQDPCLHIADLVEFRSDIRYLKDWQGTQRDALERLEKKIDTLAAPLEGKIDGLRNWIMGALLASLLALLGVVANLLIKLQVKL